MRRGSIAGVVIGVMAGVMPLQAGAETEASPGMTIQKIVVAALVKDAARAAEVESLLTDRFSKRGAQASGLHGLFPQSVPVPQMLERLRAGGFGHLLCLAPRKSIRITLADRTSKVSSMESCLNAYATSTFPEGESLDFSVTADRPRPNPPSTSMNSPIPSSPAAAPIRVIKGTLRLFDIASGKLRWHGTAQAKVPEELQTDLQTKLIVQEAWDVIESAGFLPKK